MKSSRAFEVTGRVTEDRQLALDAPLPIPGPNRVRVFVFLEENGDLSESDWNRFLSSNLAIDDLGEGNEGDYSFKDGRPFRAQG